MHVILWRFRARPEREADFVAAYGEAGPWAELFGSAVGFIGTELLRGSDGTYLSIDRWESEEAYRAFQDAHRARYDEIDAACSALTIEEAFLAAVSA